MPQSDAIAALKELDLSELEAQCYVHLLANSPATAYRIARDLGKTAPIIYKTFDMLEQQGLVLVDDGAKRLYRAVPATEVLARLERRFKKRQAQALSSLTQITPAAGDNRIYSLKTYEQVQNRIQAMLARAEQQVVIDGSQQMLNDLVLDLTAALARKVNVVIKSDGPLEIKGAEVIVDSRSMATATNRDRHWCNLVVDETEHLLSRFDGSGREVRQAVWSDSDYLAWIYACGIRSELMIDQISRLIVDRAGKNEATLIKGVRRILRTYTESHKAGKPSERRGGALRPDRCHAKNRT